VQPLPDEVNDPKTADQDPEFAQEDTNKTSTDLMAVVKVRISFLSHCCWDGVVLNCR